MKHLVLVNPVAGRGQGAKYIPLIEQHFRQAGLDFALQRTERPWHAAELAYQAAKNGVDVVIPAGGDGTVSEALNGLMRAKMEGRAAPALGILSIGTGNDLAAVLGIPRDIPQAIDALKNPRRKTIDVGVARGDCFAQERYFGNCIGIGFDAAGTIQAQKITYARGLLAYLIAAVKTIFTYHASAPTVEIEMDEHKLSLSALMVSIMNGKRIGGGFLTAPEAQPDDGWLDVCIARAVSRARMFTLIPHFLKGTQPTQPEIQMARTKTITIRATQGYLPIQADGEVLCERGGSLSIEIFPQQIDVIGVA